MDFLNFDMDTINADMEMTNLYTIQELVKEEIKRRKNLEDEDFRKKNSKYIGKYFMGEDSIIKIVNFDFDKKYSFICLLLNEVADYENEDIILNFEKISLLSNDPYNFGNKIIDRYKEITEDEFKRIFKNKIEEICFGVFKCQG